MTLTVKPAGPLFLYTVPPERVQVLSALSIICDAVGIVRPLGDGVSVVADGALTDCVEHEAVVPPLLPAHVQLQGPMPTTYEAVPLVQRLVLGALVTLLLFAEPQTPITAPVLTKVVCVGADGIEVVGVVCVGVDIGVDDVVRVKLLRNARV
jgi:hypothetical protein